jgi:uncharacterized protein
MSLSSPTSTENRIHSLDILRGFAILGILLMNIQSFAMIDSAYINPLAFKYFTGYNKIIWMATHIFADQKFINIFSILFGAGVILFSANSGKKGNNTTKLYYRRIGFLLLFGLLHAYLFWHYDILVTYTLCGFWVFLLRKKSPNTLMIIGSILFIIPLLFYLATGFSIDYMNKEDLKKIMETWLPDPNALNNYISTYRGSWINQMKLRVPHAFMFHTSFLLVFMGWKVSGLMLIGMALFKNGVLSNQKSKNFYKTLAVIGLLTGMTLTTVGIVKNFQHNWAMEFSMFFGYLFNYVGSLFTSLGYISIIVLLSNKKFMAFLFQKTGRMAFTNYLFQTFICTTIFYGHGFGLFGKVDRLEQLLFVLSIWVLLIAFSNLWLKHFKYGPFEWLWRMLTYKKKLKLKI